MTSTEQLRKLIASPEGSRMEFKTAAGSFSFEELVKYCVALANEGGGTIVLGVSDKRPRRIVGTAAFAEPGRTEAGLFAQLHQRIPVEEHDHEDKRVLVVKVPSRPPGAAWQYKGAFLMRAGDALVAMTDDQLRRIYDETGPDYSAELCVGAKLADLEPDAIRVLRDLWGKNSLQQDIAVRPVERLLADAELLHNGQLTYAAIILLGTRAALGRHLAQAEIIFEYRSSELPGPAADRIEFRQGFLPVLDQIWQRINLRNDRQSYQHHMNVWTVPTFNEQAVREALLNAVSHRDYRDGGSVFVRQYQRRIEIVSPGGFPAGVTPETVLWQQRPRNRRLAEVLGKCGLVERAGQGFDLIYRECIRQSKPLPDFLHTDAHSVWVTLHGEIQDPEFLRFLEEIGAQQTAAFTTDDFLVVDLVHREQPVTEHLQPQIAHLLEKGIIEKVGRGRGVRYMLSKRFYRHLGKPGVYTRKRGLDKETNKALLLKHLEDNGHNGVPFAEFCQVLPALSRSGIQRLINELRKEGRVRLTGERKAARWFYASEYAKLKHKLKHKK